ncbi:histone-like nucleoid-structuring protein Lsr2 [Nonomuraea sp. NPDC005650]|uniref:Lsr2 family DNA-binding protein n=1 Tax=Nonomuraea sp. NPDC005650 TaxID=3157045 RepID=UPI00339DB38A
MTVTLDRPTVKGMTPDHARALVLLVDGKTAQEAARETGVPLGRLAQLVRLQRGHIHPTTGKVRNTDDPNEPLTLDPQVRALADRFTPPEPEQAPACDSPEGIAELLREAATYESTDSKIQRALERVHGAADRLRDLVYTAAERAETARQEAEAAAQKTADREAANARVANLKRQLAEALNEANQLKETTRRARGSDSEPSESSKIRAWAKANGYQVSERGRIPAKVIAAYNAA